MARWLAFSAFSPLMEVLIGAQRTPWYDYDEEMIKIAWPSSASLAISR